jgi:nucleoid-associated protein YgaU
MTATATATPRVTATATAAPATSKPVIHIVQPGQWLSVLAGIYYNDILQWPAILAANEDQLSNADEVEVGMALVIPSLTHTVRAGETVANLAERYYANRNLARVIVAANAEIESESAELTPGQTVIIPPNPNPRSQ